MIRNVALKNFLINTVFRLFTGINSIIPKNDHKILLYSDLGFRDNTKSIYDYMIKNGYNDKYQIVCAVNDYQKYKDTAPDNVKFVNRVTGIFDYWKSGHVFYSFGRIPIEPRKNQQVTQMWHGTSFKGFAKNQTQTSNKKHRFYTQVFASSDYFIPIVEKKFAIDRNDIVVCGHPRTDILLTDYKHTHYDLGDFERIILWLPTFRKSSKLGQSNGDSKLILPLLSTDDFKSFDQWLAQRNVRVIAKLHPLQDTSNIKGGFTNLNLYSNDDFSKYGWDLYQVLKQADALITDYSSVFYDYLLLNRPIGFTEDDKQDYKNNRGFAVNDPDKFRPGAKMKTKENLYSFIESVIQDDDKFEMDRVNINNIANKYQDGMNAKRALKLSGVSKL
ncbi:CDP-glycerol glycerophosphotransferase family protein [Lactobacillus sp. CBA3605]|uniref:CDP-glycerol glycerophosphotransferase family protein n=1 Tax=Lactobacillus sp. CBA3605 TaxID=2099788 RepID=UPI00131A2D9F|nr:CDP-glycerol glycerophosphotransferase family protein [Lactobacillus sp. CBA3605]